MKAPKLSAKTVYDQVVIKNVRGYVSEPLSPYIKKDDEPDNVKDSKPRKTRMDNYMRQPSLTILSVSSTSNESEFSKASVSLNSITEEESKCWMSHNELLKSMAQLKKTLAIAHKQTQGIVAAIDNETMFLHRWNVCGHGIQHLPNKVATKHAKTTSYVAKNKVFIDYNKS